MVDEYGLDDVGLALGLAEDLVALAEAEAEAELFVAFATVDIFTEVAFGLGEVLAALAEVVLGTASAVAGLGVVLGWCAPIVIAAATPPGAPTTVPASAATVIAGYFRVHDWLASERTIGDLRLCLA